MFKHLLTATVLCAGAAVFAQSPPKVGKVAEVQGVVTVSNGATVATAVPGAIIIEGNRFVTAASGSARLAMDNGCDIRLKPNESLVVDGKRDCAALIALIQPVGGNVAAVGVGGGAAAGSGGNLAIGLGIGGTILAVGANNTRSGSAGSSGAGGGIPVVPISGQ